MSLVFGPNSGGVIYTLTSTTIVTPGDGFNLSISYPDAADDVTINNIPAGNVLTANNGTLGVLAVVGTSNYVIPPGLTGTVDLFLSLLGTTNIFVGGTATIDSTVSALAGMTINVDGGTATAASGVLAGALGSSTINLDNGGTFGNGAALIGVLNNATINFGPNGGELIANAGGATVNLSTVTINGFDAAIDKIEFTNMPAVLDHYTITTSGGSQVITLFSASAAMGSVTVAGTSLTNGTVSQGQSGPLTISRSGSNYTLDVQASVLCYLRGTRILTPTGEKNVAELRIGDLLITRFGGFRPIKWIGRQSYYWRFLRNNPAKLPIRIRADALGDGAPLRDLLVSPGHSLLLEGQLVLADSLLNDVTVIREPMPEVDSGTSSLDYYQVEFESHDCVVAEGVWAESFADGPGLRAQYHNVTEFFALYPDHPPPDELALCAARPARGAGLEAALRPVVARAAAKLSPGRLEGFIDAVTDWHIQGWALDTAHPELPVLLEIRLEDRLLGTVLAFESRDDLRAHGKGSGRCAFAFKSPIRLPQDAINALRISRASDGAALEATGVCRAACASQALRAVA